MNKSTIKALAVAWLLSGCSALDLLKPASPGIAVDAQVGDRQIDATVGEKKAIEVGDVEGDANITQTDKEKPVEAQTVGQVVQQDSTDLGALTLLGGFMLIVWLLSTGGMGWALWTLLKEKRKLR